MESLQTSGVLPSYVHSILRDFMSYFAVRKYIRYRGAYVKFHLETVAGNEVARNTLGQLEFDHLHNNDQAIKHWIISASAGEYHAMYH
jgi:hypothetical protein